MNDQPNSDPAVPVRQELNGLPGEQIEGPCPFVFLQQLLAERQRQDQLWGGNAHDDHDHCSIDWKKFIIEHTRRAAFMFGERECVLDPEGGSKIDAAFNVEAVQTAALVLAMVQSYHRRFGRTRKAKAFAVDVLYTAIETVGVIREAHRQRVGIVLTPAQVDSLFLTNFFPEEEPR